MSTDPNLDAMVQTMKVADQLLEDMHDALAKANDIFDLHEIRIEDGLPVLDQPVAGNVYLTTNETTAIVAVFERRPADAWWDPFTWTDAYGKRDYVPFGCGSISMYHEGPAHPGDRVLRIHLRHKLMKGWERIALALKQVLSREQFLELADICDSPEDATTWGPWMTAIETGA